jgi:hypothetical protein
MNSTDIDIPRSLRLKAGDWVVVRDAAEILSTLDEDGCLDRLPFMPEMLAHCGKRYRVRAVAHKTCDTIEATGGRRMRDTVHLDDLRCDGSAHGGCEAGCTLFWKEAWLRRDSQAARPAIAPAAGNLDVLQRACTREGSVPDDPTWRCQTTDLLKASEPLRPTEVGQYVRDVTTGNHGVFDVLRLLMLAGYERLVNVGVGYRVWAGLYNAWQRLRGGKPWPSVTGRVAPGAPTPTAVLDLKPGDRVRVRPIREIEQTINAQGFNRGMRFDVEMVKYCDAEYKVQSRVTKIINEKTGKMMHMSNPCILLEDVYCRAECTPGRRGCPRAVNTYWREIWLERV